MNLSVTSGPVFSQKLPAIVLFAFENERPAGPPALQQLLHQLTDREFSGGEKQQLLLHTAGQLPTPRLLLAGLGRRDQFNLEKLRRAMGRALKLLRDAGLDRAAVQVTDSKVAQASSLRAGLGAYTRSRDRFAARRNATFDRLFALVEAAILADYRFTKFKPENGRTRDFQSLTWCLPAGTDLAAAERVAARARIVADAANYARAIANLPGNIVSPEALAGFARKLARECHLKCTVLDQRALTKRGFGGLLAVGGGSVHPPRLIALEYRGPAGRRSAARDNPIALVGKAITFDSGGISIKSSDRMDEMKFDKCGGVAVLGALRAIAQLRLPLHVIGVIAAAENLPSASSYRPGDIITSYPGADSRGVTIEVLNTDAEGRIVLGDAVAFARERHAQAIIDLATLTAACVVALGPFAAGLIGNDESLQEKIRAAAERTGERVWPLPLWQEYRDKIKSDVADHKNTGGREGGAITGAAFIGRYAGDVPWAHLDIAGTAATKEDHPYLSKGATGFGVRLLADLLQNWE